MLQEALEYLFDQAAERVKPIDLKITDDPKTRFFVIDGEVKEIPVPTAPRNHKVKSLADLAKAVTRFGDEAAVFYDESNVVGVLDNTGDRVEHATFKLEPSDRWRTVCELRQRPWLTQKDFVRLLKIDLAGTIEPGVLLDLVRSIRFENGQTVRGEISRQKESLGRSITASVSTEREIPETVELALPLYKSLGESETYYLKCSVEVDPTREAAFRLLPLPDEIERVEHLAMESIRERLEAELGDVPVFYGSP